MHLKKIISYILLFLFVLNNFFQANFVIAEDSETPIEIANPVFTTKGIDEVPYTLKAVSGIKKGDILELYQIEGKIKNRNNIWIYLNADKANYNQISQVVFLYDNIQVYTDNEEKLISDEAIIDIQQDTITLISNVEYKNTSNRIKADKSIISNGFQNFEYFGSVNTSINNY